MRNPASARIRAGEGVDTLFSCDPADHHQGSAGSLLAALASDFGFAHFLLARDVKDGFEDFRERLVLSNWPEALVEAYDASGAFAGSALMRSLSQTRLPVFNEGCLLAETGQADDGDDLAALFLQSGLRATLGIRIVDGQGEAVLLVLSGDRPPLSSGERALFTYCALEFLESLEKSVMMSETLKDELSARELACLRFAAEGKSSDDIAVILGVSTLTISSYFRSASEKLESANRMQAIAKAIRMKLI